MSLDRHTGQRAWPVPLRCGFEFWVPIDFHFPTQPLRLAFLLEPSRTVYPKSPSPDLFSPALAGSGEECLRCPIYWFAHWLLTSSLYVSACCWDPNAVPLTGPNSMLGLLSCRGASAACLPFPPFSPWGETGTAFLWSGKTPSPTQRGKPFVLKTEPSLRTCAARQPKLRFGGLGNRMIEELFSPPTRAPPSVRDFPSNSSLAGRHVPKKLQAKMERENRLPPPRILTLLPTARKRGQHLGIYQKTRMCLFICLLFYI